MSDPSPPITVVPESYGGREVWVVQPRKPRYWLHILLLLVTTFTTLVVGARMQDNFRRNLPALYTGNESLPIFPVRWAVHGSNLALGVPFSFCLMIILLSHEMGHYLFCRYYGVAATLPFFIPFPTLIGTLGAFIRIRSPIRSRSALFDIGIAGPIAGFVVALTVLIFAMPYSKVGTPPVISDIQLGYPLIFKLVWAILPLADIHGGSSPMSDIYFHPMAIAAWVGMFATALNLLPGGQLDGGHIVFSLAPRAHKFVSRITILALIPIAIKLWLGWLVWAVLLRISGMRHPMVPEWPGVAGPRRWMALFGLIMLVLTLTPAPFAHSSLLQVWSEFRGR
ncbi:MAG: site-2 protease family protein [Acidobacteria bacterium]|nr:MAG: site-2 protease family protein [Acidobacteriota bacterium]